MKRVIVLIVCFAIIFTFLAACSQEGDDYIETSSRDNNQMAAIETEPKKTKPDRPESTSDGRKASDFVPTYNEFVGALKKKYPEMNSWKNGKTLNNNEGSVHLYTDAGDALSVVSVPYNGSYSGYFTHKNGGINFSFSFSGEGVEFEIKSSVNKEKVYSLIMSVVLGNVPDGLLLTEKEMLEFVSFEEVTKLGFHEYRCTFSGITYEVSKYKNSDKNPSYTISTKR